MAPPVKKMGRGILPVPPSRQSSTVGHWGTQVGFGQSSADRRGGWAVKRGGEKKEVGGWGCHTTEVEPSPPLMVVQSVWVWGCGWWAPAVESRTKSKLSAHAGGVEERESGAERKRRREQRGEGRKKAAKQQTTWGQARL